MEQKAVLAKELLLSSGYITINKTVMQKFGLEAAFLLSSFAEAENLLADEEGWFYQTTETVERNTTLSRYKQNNAIALLEEHGILEQENKGMPMKRYFRINYDRLADILFQKPSQPRVRETSDHGCEKLATNKELNNITNINNTSQNASDDTPPLKQEPQYSKDSPQMELAQLLASQMRENNPGCRLPNTKAQWQNWADVFRLMEERDNRTQKDMENMIKFSQWHDFWKTNILSPTSLRKQYDKLTLERNRIRGISA